jgi:hypothetical protein
VRHEALDVDNLPHEHRTRHPPQRRVVIVANEQPPAAPAPAFAEAKADRPVLKLKAKWLFQ